MKKQFLASYTIDKGKNDVHHDIETAIENEENWKKAPCNDTTFYGEIEVTGDDSEQRKNSATKIIKEFFKQFSDNYDRVEVTLMVDGQGKAIDFTV